MPSTDSPISQTAGTVAHSHAEETQADGFNANLNDRVWVHVALIVICGLIALPLFWMLFSAFKNHDDIFNKPLWWIPVPPHLIENVENVFQSIDFGRYFFNSLFVATVVTACDLTFSTMAGYALAKYEFPGQKLIFGGVVATMMIPFIVVVIPQYLIIRYFGLLDTYAALILPFAVSSFGIFFMRQALKGVPDELIDAARIDGAGEWLILLKIVVPLNIAPLVSLGILRFLAEWDNLLWPLIATNSDGMRTMSLGLALLQDDRYGTDIPLLMTAAALSIAPIIVAYAFLQRYFIKGIAGTGLNQ